MENVGKKLSDLLKDAKGVVGHMYRVGLRGDKQEPYSHGLGQQPIYKTKKGEVYATDDIGNIVPISPQGRSNNTTTIPSVNQVEPQEPRRLAVENYQGGSKTPIPLPNQTIQDLLWKHLPTEATPSATVIAGENGGFDLNAINQNNDGSKDYGLGQLNDYTYNEMMGKQPFRRQLQEAGVNSVNDLLGDAERAVKAFKVFRDYEKAPRWTGDEEGSAPWSRWYGWQNKGYTINPELTIEQLAKNPAYFKLREFVENQ